MYIFIIFDLFDVLFASMMAAWDDI